MTKNGQSKGGLIICGGCAISANPNSNEPSSTEMFVNAVRGLFTRRKRNAASRTVVANEL